MSYRKSVVVVCDGDRCIAQTDYGHKTATRERQQARKNGWKTCGGEDYCPECDPE